MLNEEALGVETRKDSQGLFLYRWVFKVLAPTIPPAASIKASR
jgi:hypothetical protein